ncbi:MAG: hypothetical protein ACJ8EL_06155 [Rhizomicrobium sp.]
MNEAFARSIRSIADRVRASAFGDDGAWLAAGLEIYLAKAAPARRPTPADIDCWRAGYRKSDRITEK